MESSANSLAGRDLDEKVQGCTNRLPDLLGVLWVVLAGVAVLLPSLLHGVYLGPYDILTKYGLTTVHGTSVHNPSLRDLITLFVPSTEQVWNQVHHGHLPLWNPYNGLGMPLAFNWESAPFSLPSLVGYLVPLNLAYTVGVLVTVVVSGVGAYVFGRVLHLGVIASAFVGTVFVLSGSMMSLLGWTSISVASWAGWLFALAALIIRGKRPAVTVAAFAVVVALMIFAGHPETVFLFIASLGMFVGTIFIYRAFRTGDSAPILRPFIRLVIGGLAGAALAAPLVLPGMQLVQQSGRTTIGNYQSLTTPDHGVLQLIFQGFDGSPNAGSHWFGLLSYQWTAAYVGVIALVMAATALGVRWRQPEVLGLAAFVVVMGALVLIPGIPSLLDGLPVVGEVILTRALIPLGFGLAVLAGFGMDALVRNPSDASVRKWTGGGFCVAAALLAVVWVFGRGHLPPELAHIRASSFVWPSISVVVGLLVITCLSYTGRRKGGPVQARWGQIAGVGLLAVETAFLVSAGGPVMASSPQPLSPTPAVTALQKAVGTSLVGLGTQSCIGSTLFGTPQPGVMAETNVEFQLHEFALYDPLAPQGYYSTWHALTGSAGGDSRFYQFCPAVTSVDQARLFGIGYVLEPHGRRGPLGSVFVQSLGDEDLYRIPGASQATLVPTDVRHLIPPASANGSPVRVSYTDSGRLNITTNAAGPQLLRLRVTDVPGWHATIDGHPLPLEEFSGVMIQTRIPPGHHLVQLHYWPVAFTAGLIISILCAIVLLIATILEARGRRKGHFRDQPRAGIPGA